MTNRSMRAAARIPLLLAGLALGACGGESGSDGAPTSASAGNAARGGEVFKLQCAVCHGETGHGDGIGAAALPVKPRNLTSEPYKYVDIAGAGSEQAALVAYIRQGRIENGMPAFGHLPEADIQSLAAHVMSLRPKPGFVEEKPADAPAPPPGEPAPTGGG